MNLEQLIWQGIKLGLTAIQIQKKLRDANMIVSFTEVKILFNKLKYKK